MRSYRTITDRGQTFASVCENKTLDVIMPSYFWRVTADKALLIPQILPNTFRNYTVRFNFMRYKSDYYHTRCVELYFRRVMWGHIALLRLNDNFIIQSIPLGDDSLNRAWWFIMGVITQSFSPKSTTWLPTQHTERHVRVQTPKDKREERDTVTVRGKSAPRSRRQTSRHDTYMETRQPQMLRKSQRGQKKQARNHKWVTNNNCTRKEGMRKWLRDETHFSSLLPANSRNNFLVLISKGDGEMRSRLWELISIKIENEIRGD